MKLLRFILYIFKHGSLRGKPLNFEKRKADILHEKYTPPSHSVYTTIRSSLISNSYTSRTLSVAAYLLHYKRINRQYFFSDINALCYVRIFKSASTSILRELLPIVDPSLNKASLTDQQIDILGDDRITHSIKPYQQNYTYFTLVRNPFHRIVSVYRDLFAPDNTFFSYQTYFFGILKKGMSFAEFISVVTRIPDTLKSPHFTSQYQIITLCELAEPVKTFRIEKDVDALHAFLRPYNISLGHQNKSGESYDYRQYYNMQTLTAVYAMYEDDIKKFDYQPEYTALKAFVQKNNL